MTTLPEWVTDPQTEQEKAFALFHAANPHVLEEIGRRALRLHHLGRKRIGIKAIVEALRYESSLRTEGDKYRFNNTHVALYARLLLHLRPELSEVVETRRAQVDRPRAA